MTAPDEPALDDLAQWMDKAVIQCEQADPSAATQWRRRARALAVLRATQPAPTPAPAGGDVAAAVGDGIAEAARELNDLADLARDRQTLYLTPKDERGYREQATSLLAAHEAAVRAVEGRLAREQDDARELARELAERAERMRHWRDQHDLAHSMLDDSRARAEALGAALDDIAKMEPREGWYAGGESFYSLGKRMRDRAIAARAAESAGGAE